MNKRPFFFSFKINKSITDLVSYETDIKYSLGLFLIIYLTNHFNTTYINAVADISVPGWLMADTLITCCSVSVSSSGDVLRGNVLQKPSLYQHFHTGTCHLPQQTHEKEPEVKVPQCETDLLTHVTAWLKAAGTSRRVQKQQELIMSFAHHFPLEHSVWWVMSRW